MEECSELNESLKSKWALVKHTSAEGGLLTQHMDQANENIAGILLSTK